MSATNTSTRADRGDARAEGQGRSGHRRHVRDRPGDRGQVRGVRRERRDQLPAPRPSEASDTEQQVQACVNRVQQEGVRDVLVQGDVSPRGPRSSAMVGQAVSELGGLDVLINNAGIQISRHSDELSSDDFDKVLGGQSPRRVPVRARGDPALPGRGQAGRDHQRLERPPADPQARLPRLFGQQGRDAEPDAHARARVRRARDPRQRNRPGCDRHADQPRVDRRSGQARAGGEPHPDGAGRDRRGDGCASRASWPATTPPTSPARRSSSTAG